MRYGNVPQAILPDSNLVSFFHCADVHMETQMGEGPWPRSSVAAPSLGRRFHSFQLTHQHFLLHLLTTHQQKQTVTLTELGPGLVTDRWGKFPTGQIWESFLAEVRSELGLDSWVITRLFLLTTPAVPAPSPPTSLLTSLLMDGPLLPALMRKAYLFI